MQPLYCTWEANGATAHTPGLFRRGRVTDVSGWINAAVGELARIEVQTQDVPAAKQESATVFVRVPEGCFVEWDAALRILKIRRTA